MTTHNVEKVVVTAGPTAPPHKTVLETPPGDKDVQVYVFTWLRQATIRTVRTYLQTFVGLVVAGGVLDVTNVPTDSSLPSVGAADFWSIVVGSAGLALAPAVVAFVQNAIELLAKLDSPETRA